MKVQPCNKNYYRPSFKSAVIAKGAYIPIKRRGEILPENAIPKMIQQIKDVFFEVFPSLDSTYKNVVKNKTIK